MVALVGLPGGLAGGFLPGLGLAAALARLAPPTTTSAATAAGGGSLALLRGRLAVGLDRCGLRVRPGHPRRPAPSSADGADSEEAAVLRLRRAGAGVDSGAWNSTVPTVGAASVSASAATSASAGAAFFAAAFLVVVSAVAFLAVVFFAAAFFAAAFLAGAFAAAFLALAFLAVFGAGSADSSSRVGTESWLASGGGVAFLAADFFAGAFLRAAVLRGAGVPSSVAPGPSSGAASAGVSAGVDASTGLSSSM